MKILSSSARIQTFSGSYCPSALGWLMRLRGKKTFSGTGKAFTIFWTFWDCVVFSDFSLQLFLFNKWCIVIGAKLLPHSHGPVFKIPRAKSSVTALSLELAAHSWPKKCPGRCGISGGLLQSWSYISAKKHKWRNLHGAFLSTHSPLGSGTLQITDLEVLCFSPVVIWLFSPESENLKRYVLSNPLLSLLQTPFYRFSFVAVQN